VEAVYDGQDSNGTKVDARGVLTGVRLEPVGGDGVPRLGVDVDIESEKPLDPSVARTPALSREDASVGGAFTAWDGVPAGAVRRSEPPVVAEPDAETHEVTAVRARPVRQTLAARMAALSGWAFVIVAIGTFGFMYLAITRLGPGTDESRRPEIAGSAGETAPPRVAAAPMRRLPLVVPSSVPSPPGAAEGAPAMGATRREGALPSPSPSPSAAPVATAVDGGKAAARAGTRARVRSRASQDMASIAAASSPLPRNENGGRNELRRGPSADQKGESSMEAGEAGGSAAAGESQGADMRGIDVAVESGVLYHEVALPRPETDGHFRVQVTPSWPTTFAIVGKSAAGFTVSFGTPAPAHAHLDWRLVR